MYTANAIPMQISVRFLAELVKLILKFLWKNKGPRIANTILIKKSKFYQRERERADVKIYYKAVVNKIDKKNNGAEYRAQK